MKWLAAVVAVWIAGFPAAALAQEWTPDYSRIRRGLQRSVPAPRLGRAYTFAARAAATHAQATRTKQRDSVWNGVLIGAAIGGVGGYIWGRNQCGSNDEECLAITTPVGTLAGAGIGAAVGALLDALNK
jgi:hypothetical protein